MTIHPSEAEREPSAGPTGADDDDANDEEQMIPLQCPALTNLTVEVTAVSYEINIEMANGGSVTKGAP